MKIRFDDPHLVDDLVHHLRRSGCVASASDVEAHGDDLTLEVQLPGSLDEDQARLELALYLRVFEATHPGKSASLLS
jgi:glycine cleavage system regulatory protein